MDTLLSLVILYIHSSSYPLTLIQCNYYRWHLHYVFHKSLRGISFHMEDIWKSVFNLDMYIDHVLLTNFSSLRPGT